FMEKLGETIVVKGMETADKAKELVEIAGIKSQIVTCEEVIKKNYMEIGKLYYEKFAEDGDEMFEKQCKSIRNAKRGVKELQQKIKEVKGI
ncbi:hypothetical protein LJC58_09905, partial [Lachnospiraceae bacterium OttesenSCG-928-D06]|nr:hypothetical protein [Lachnospiraceae bacterium OttesenSCG-928-D06]